MISLPLFLTLLRLILSPLLLPYLFSRYVPYKAAGYNRILMALFAALGVTDFFDGWLARRWGQTSLLGQLFDPLADKILITATLVSLVSLRMVPVYPVLIMLCRDLFITGLRELCLAHGVQIAVIYTAKLKTALQMLYVLWVLWNNEQVVPGYRLWAEQITLYSALACTLYSAYHYTRTALLYHVLP
jgi:CDP-diacylglycerol--glycerol-3-phosphate 3-phosphatidyltransferase